jgi:phosphate transport system substrate-binding protein
MGVSPTIAAAGTNNYQLNSVGSDVTYCAMKSIDTTYTKSQATTSGDTALDTPPYLGTPIGCVTTPATFTVPADTVHGAINYNCNLQNTTLASPLTTTGPITSLSVAPTGAALPSGGTVKLVSGTNSQTYTLTAAAAVGATTLAVASATPNFAYPSGTAVDAHDCTPGDGAVGNLPPDGSSAGLTAFINDAGKGNIAYVRSTSGRSSSNPATLEFWAYGLDAVSWDHFSTNTSAPKTLNAKQIQGIYNCTYTTWKQVGGSTTAKIARYFPVVGSGTATFFAKVFLGGSVPVSTPTCPIKFVPQNDATQVATAAQKTAILPYSYANFYAQTHLVNGEKNLAAGTVLGAVNNTAPSSTTISEAEAITNVSGDACTSTPLAGKFCASRYVYNITWQSLPAAYYAAVINEIGVPSSGVPSAQSICSNTYHLKLSQYGFVPLAQATTAQSTSSDPVPGISYCRQF